jgi:hypothetical protein
MPSACRSTRCSRKPRSAWLLWRMSAPQLCSHVGAGCGRTSHIVQLQWQQNLRRGNSPLCAGQKPLVPRHSPAYLPRQVLQHGHPKPVALLTPGAGSRRPVVFSSGPALIPFSPDIKPVLRRPADPTDEASVPAPAGPRRGLGASLPRIIARMLPARLPAAPRGVSGSPAPV